MAILRRTLGLCVIALGARAGVADPAGRRDAPTNAGRNCHVALEEYQQTNDRDFLAYASHLGAEFSDRFPTDAWLDGGAGFGLATLGALFEKRVARAVVINAQNALEPLRARDYEWFRRHAGYFKTARITLFAGLDGIDAAIEDPVRGALKPNALEILVDHGARKLAEVEGAGRFTYLTGLAGGVVPRVRGRFSLVTDVFGAYFYSARRPQLLARYYDRLATDGVALIVLRAGDVRRTFDDERVTEYGPRDRIRRRDGRSWDFVDHLIDRYPRVFAVRTSNLERANAEARHRVLIMRRDRRVSSLAALETIRILAITYGPHGIHRQIPEVNFVE